MPYCWYCGTKLSEGAVYCQKCGKRVREVGSGNLAGWGERLVAWVIDMVLLGVFLMPIKFFVRAAWLSLMWAPSTLRWIPFIDFGLDNIIYFLYWMLMEGTTGQSIGKMAMRVKVTMMSGEPVDLAHAAVESLGKAFLLPIDCIVGWILYQRRGQRLFNYVSDTIVVKTSP